ncbi:MAG: TIGR01459 family HAD-type hydrolase [Holosporales bacterium]|jgi:HAD superfamily hydrolase (TIGR01459 family)|nr:TIGR01459 family HAD-type hydrolase [Holosporales bacterium]
MKTLQSVSDIIEHYDVYFVDIWGVLYNEGEGVIATACSGLQALQDTRKTVVLVSNSPRLGEAVITFLEGEGISRKLYQHIVTSGDCTRQYFESQGKPVLCYLVGRPHNQAMFKDLPITFVEAPEQAEVLVLCAPDRDSPTLDPFIPLLDRCLAAHVPMVCANPDEYVLVKGEKIVRTGLLAQYYAEQGGQVTLCGKPYAPIYERAKAFVSHVEKVRLLAIGDGLKTDILGAQNFGINSLWICSGVSAGTHKRGITPTYTMQIFQ